MNTTFVVLGYILIILAVLILISAFLKENGKFKSFSDMLALIALMAFFGSDSSNSSSKSSNSSATVHKTTKKEKGQSVTAAPKHIEVNYDSYDVATQKVFKTNYQDTSWQQANVKVDSVKLIKLAKAYKYDSANDGKFQIQGFVRVHYTIKANADISIYPTQGTYSYSNGEQHEADAGETWDGDIDSGAVKTGNVDVPAKNLNNINTLRVKFTAYPQSSSDTEKDYDFTINLK